MFKRNPLGPAAELPGYDLKRVSRCERHARLADAFGHQSGIKDDATEDKTEQDHVREDA